MTAPISATTPTPPPPVTTPQPGATASPLSAITPQQEQDALESISQMMVGSQMLKDEPGVVYALAQEQAHPADAGAIDQFMQGLDAEKQVRIAQAAGTKIVLSNEQKTLLGGLNVDYSGVEYTQQSALADTVSRMQADGQQVQKDAQGNPVLDAQGNVQTVQHPYKAKGIGRLFQTLHNDFIKPLTRDVVSPVTHGLNDAWNVVDQTVSTGYQGYLKTAGDMGVAGDLLNPMQGVRQIWRAANGESTGPLMPDLGALPNDVSSIAGDDPQQLQQMKDDGYDPNNFFSILAYRAAGKEHGDLSPLARQWDAQNPAGLYGWSGQQAVAEASRFTENPKAYTSAIIGDQTLTPEQIQAKMAAVDSPQFQTLARQVQSKTSTLGNGFASAVGIDPVKHPTAFALTSAGADLAGSFMIDPTILLGKALKIAKLSQIGIDTLGDANGATRALRAAADYASTTGAQRVGQRILAPSTARLANGWQTAFDLSDGIRAANAAGDTTREAALTAKFQATLPTLSPLLEDFIGKHAIVDYVEGAAQDGKRTQIPVFGETGGIRNFADAVNYVDSKVGLTRLVNGRAALQSSLTPGALSAFGLRKLKGALADWSTTRSSERAVGAQSKFISHVMADPDFAASAKSAGLITENDLFHILPEANDAVDASTETVLAHDLENGGMVQTEIPTLRSAARASDFPQYELTNAGKGRVAYNLRSSGNPIGTGTLGWTSPTAIAARSRMVAQRLSTFLPRNNLLDIEDSATGEKIQKMAMFFLNRGDANSLRAAYNVGDGGQRKAIIEGLIDQLYEASGASKSKSGSAFMDAIRTRVQSYSTAGDEAILNGSPMALHAGQVRTTWLLPSFRDWQKMASKIGLYDATMGRALTSDAADSLMTQWKMGALFKPSTVTRNQLEGWLRTALEGQLGPALKARAMLTMPNKELWARGHALDAKAEYERLIADGDTKGAREIALGNMMGGDVLGRSAVTQKVAESAPMALVGRAYRRLYSRAISEDELNALDEVSADHLTQMIEGYGQQMTEAALGGRNAAVKSSEAAKAGYGPALLKRSLFRARNKSNEAAEGQSVSWTQQDTDGTLGADRFANALALRVNKTPTVAHAAADVLEHPDQFDVHHVVAALDDPAVRRQIRLTGYGSLFWEDGSSVARNATTDDERALGKIEFANKVINDYRALLTGQNGRLASDLISEIRQTGKAPDGDWISGHLNNMNRPEGVLAPEITAMPAGAINAKNVMTQLQDVEGAAYQWMVERPLQRTTSSPVYWANYSKARVGLNPYVDRMVREFGISEEAAKNFAQELATKQGWIKTEQLIDDPGQKTQFDIVARNMFPFSRATQAMVRRWGGGLWQDPTRARKMMLAYEGAVHSGLVYTNTYGEPTFTYPGSGVMNSFLRDTLGHVPGFENMFRFPVASTMTGGVLMSVPGADNPFRMSMGPMISVPLREIEKFFPDQKATFDRIDSAINGPIGVGETFAQFEPTLFRKFYTAMDTNSRNSALSSSMMGAIANLGAAGLVPGQGASPSELDSFIQRVKNNTRNQLFVRAILGAFAPAAPSSPTEGTSGSGADFAFQMTGIKQLSDEYKTIINETGGDVARANAIFTALHPDKAVWYETPQSQANASKVSLSSTDAALNWMTKNTGFVNQYKSVAAYFLPQATSDEPFSDQAYKTQLELGLRQHKTPQEFYNDVRVRDAENTYYPMVADFDAKLAQAKASGNTDQFTQLTQQKSDWETQFKEMNPLFAAKLDQFGPTRATATGQLADLHKMVQDGSVPDGLGGLLSSLLSSWDGYVQFGQVHKGSDAANTAARSQALSIFNNWVQSNIVGTPLQDLYDGVFRALDTNIVNLQPAPTGS